MHRVSGETFEEIETALDGVVHVDVVAEGHLLEVVECCDYYFSRYLTKAQARTWLTGLAARVEQMIDGQDSNSE